VALRDDVPSLTLVDAVKFTVVVTVGGRVRERDSVTPVRDTVGDPDVEAVTASDDDGDRCAVIERVGVLVLDVVLVREVVAVTDGDSELDADVVPVALSVTVCDAVAVLDGEAV
jgi:hypothetical protein